MRWPVKLYRVSGHSMMPAFRPGDTLLGWRGWHNHPAARLTRPGRVVVAAHGAELVVKRITSCVAGQLTLIGDNPVDSLDSRHFGTLPLAAVEAVILTRLP